MSPIIIVGLVILSFMSVKSFTANPIEKEAKADIRAMERRLDPASDAEAAQTSTETVPDEQAQTTDNSSPVAIIQVPGAEPPQAEVLDPQDGDLSQGDFPQDVDLGNPEQPQLGVGNPDEIGNPDDEDLPGTDLEEDNTPLDDNTNDVNNPEDPLVDFPERDQEPAPVNDIFPDNNNDSNFGSDPLQSDTGEQPGLGSPGDNSPTLAPAPDQGS